MGFECPQLERNLADCPCTYEGCSLKGNCCECLRHHLAHQQLPACAFPPEVERTYDRSFRRFAQLYA
ncbi:MAG TPA: cytosolic protein [Armatimonadetes bacterium]|nr:cytosolic protein [Armatimonadota bacterium]